MNDTESRLLATFPSGKRDEVHFNLRHYQDQDYLDIRVWFKPDGGTFFKPTRKGLTIASHWFPGLLQALEKLAGSIPESIPEPPKPAAVKTWRKGPSRTYSAPR